MRRKKNMEERKRPIPLWSLIELLNNNTFIDHEGHEFKFETSINKNTKCDLKIDESKIKDVSEEEKEKEEENYISPPEKEKET